MTLFCKDIFFNINDENKSLSDDCLFLDAYFAVSEFQRQSGNIYDVTSCFCFTCAEISFTGNEND